VEQSTDKVLDGAITIVEVDRVRVFSPPDRT
jgi:hypothetical protein